MVPVLIGVVLGVVVSAGMWWWSRRPRVPARVELCCFCNAEVRGDEIHVVMEVPSDDRMLGIDSGETGMAAEFCAEHCPGTGCRHPVHAKLVA